MKKDFNTLSTSVRQASWKWGEQMNMKVLIQLVLIASLIVPAPQYAFALPQGENLVAGEASFERDGNAVLNIRQHSDTMIADYDSFSIGTTEAVHFIQPSASSTALNRVVGSDPSRILGQLTATGKIFLINPNGVLFGASARVDTSGLVASTLNIRNEDFLAGRYHFIDGQGVITNQGLITAPGGYVALLGNRVNNEGIIEAQLGSVALASGEAVTLNLDNEGLISVAIDAPISNGPDDGGLSSVTNSGQISARGGRVILSTKSLENVLQNSVNNSGVISANSLVEREGEIYLLAEGPSGAIVNTGTLDASAKVEQAHGGFIETSAGHLDLNKGNMSASSISGKPGTIFLDPEFFNIDDAWEGLFGTIDGSNLIVEATQDVNFQLSDNLLDLINFDTESFSVHAGRDINQNDDRIVTHGGKVSLLADLGDIKLGAPIETNGGDVDIEAPSGKVVHQYGADVLTRGGHFKGKAGDDYEINNGVTIDTDSGILDIFAGQNIVLGTPGDTTRAGFSWEYISEERIYSFLEFGYYYRDGNNIVYVPLSKGPNIGHDGTSPLSGSGVIENWEDVEFYTEFSRASTQYYHPSDTSGKDQWRYHSEADLNEDGLDHLKVTQDRYGWEDIWGLGDRDFDDAVIDFTFNFQTISAGAKLSSDSNMFLTADQGAISQAGGTIEADNLMISTNQGMTGPADNGGLAIDVNNLSAVNKSSGNIQLANDKTLRISDLTALSGLNSGVNGTNGIENNSPGGRTHLTSAGDTLIDAPVKSKGDIVIQADGNIDHTPRGAVSIDNTLGLTLNPPEDVTSPSHQASVWSNDKTIDVTWRLPDLEDGCCAGYTAQAQGHYSMAAGSKIFTDSGHATITANDDIALSLVDAGNGNVSVTSNFGSILDNDLGVTPTDYDVIGHTIQLDAPNGTVGGPGAGQEIDIGYPLSFSFLFDELTDTAPDLTADAFTATLEGSGEWLFSMSFTTPFDSDRWWFHIATVDEFHGLSSSSVHLGPFKIDTIAPIITAFRDDPNENGWYNHDVTVNFVAHDERSGFSPDGDLTKQLSSPTTSGEGIGLIITSEGISDRAGNPAVPLEIALNVDKTAPVITSGTPQGTPGTQEGTYVSDVTVPFSATDNLSGFDPDGALSTDLPPKTTSGLGDDLTVTSDGVTDLAGNFTPGIMAGPFNVVGNIPPRNIIALGVQDNLFDFYRAYYEILYPSRFLSFEPATKIGLYAYHPLTEMDDSAFDEIKLDVGAYEFIEDNIEFKNNLPDYYEE